MVIPFAPAPGWFSLLFSEMARGRSFEESAEAVSGRVKSREFARTTIEGAMLAIPVEGGASVLKRRGADPTVAEHGRWRHTHLGAWNAAYGKCPFFSHFYPALQEIYQLPAGLRLEEWNRHFAEIVIRMLRPEDELPALRQMAVERGVLFKELQREMTAKINYNLSIFDALFRYGRETLFGLVEI